MAPPPLQPGFVSAQEYVHRLVKPSVDHVCRLKFPTGNYPPCVGDERDLLVHWCHGSPGVIYMLLQAYRVRRRGWDRGATLWPLTQLTFCSPDLRRAAVPV